MKRKIGLAVAFIAFFGMILVFISEGITDKEKIGMALFLFIVMVFGILMGTPVLDFLEQEREEQYYD